ncbi:EF-hand domain-containing protein [Pseudodonghicola xiamenensis]|uniref:EF-hand domain-containing protein n=1 Tax=Pseudodonghicola xiamenensis TaxID=337702 RepID=A0A8J3H528_9RHOB|nr:hypothetical protein [Pseudodonghicola xiamenensis]GHG87751.1 hypothetical protein GCM10010961_16480 [Pseudodonghicola xiamenensis]
MKPFSRTTLTFAAATLALPALAWAAETADTDGDGLLSFEEVQAIAPKVTEEMFLDLDANADGGLDAEELAEARKIGLIPLAEE